MDTLRGLFWLASLLLRATWWVASRGIRLLRGASGRVSGRRKAQGSARWARRWEQWWYRAIRGEGVILGRGAFRRLLRFSSDGMVMVFAAMGAGKGLGVVIPSLLTYRGSMVVTDPKGENYAITRRRRATFGKVWMLNPTDLVHSERFNPLDMIRLGEPQEADDAEALARLMVVPDARESHWDDKAVSLIKGLILHVMNTEPPASRTLATVRRLSSGQRETFLANLIDMATPRPGPPRRLSVPFSPVRWIPKAIFPKNSSPSSPTFKKLQSLGRTPARRASCRPVPPSDSRICWKAPAHCISVWMRTCWTCMLAGSV